MTVNGGTKMRVMVVDDSEVVRLSLRKLFATAEEAEGIDLVGEAPDGETGVQLAGELQPDVVVMDLKMPGISGIEATWQLGSVAPTSEVLMLTVSDDQADVTDAVLAGAKGYVVKGASDEEILDAIRRVAEGRRAVPADIAADLVERTRVRELDEPEIGSATAVSTQAPPQAAVAERAGSRNGASPASAASPLQTVFAGRHLAQTVGIAVVIGVLLTLVGQGEEIMSGDASAETWIKGAVNIVVAFALINIGLLAGSLSARS